MLLNFEHLLNNKITVRYDKVQKRVSVINNILDNTFDNPVYISFYRTDKYGLQKDMLIGECAVVSRQQFKPIDVQIIYFASDTVRPKNTINVTKLQTLLNSNSLNQAFARFNVLPNIIRIKDTLNNTMTDYNKAYNAIGRICMTQGRAYTTDQHPTTIYIVMTELQFTKSENNGVIEERGGGVRDNSNLAIIWTISNSSEDKEKLIVHEIGHTLGLKDVFNDDALGKPSQKFSRHNYMDYDVIRKMFFKTQMQTIFNNLE